MDPADPCRVCYCQGGEVVCRRIACFVRDDCRPRLVPGRCCPEYDNCPLRGVTSLPGISPSTLSLSTAGVLISSAVPTVPKENIKQEITIKEITPVSEIPIITEVKIKEILPSPSSEVGEYSSSKSPLIPREATSEKNIANQAELTERPVVIEIHPSSSPVVISSSLTSVPTTTSTDNFSTINFTNDATPSKISFSTQDSVNSEIYPSNVPSVATAGSSSVNFGVTTTTTTTTKAPVIIEEEDTPFDHNPAFPPLPDDLSVLGSHDDEIMPETNVDNEHIPSSHEILTSTTTSTEASTTKKVQVKVFKDIPEEPLTTEKTPEVFTVFTESSTVPLEVITSTEFSSTKENSMLNLRSAIPTEILNLPSLVPEDITGELDEIETTLTTQSTPVSTTANTPKSESKTENPKSEIEPRSSTENVSGFDVVTPKSVETTEFSLNTKNSQEQTTSSIAKSNEATEVASQTEISSLPIETSDQNPHDVSESITKEKIAATTTVSSLVDTVPTKILVTDPEIITVSKLASLNTESHSTENIETTEFVLTSFGSSESATDGVELIKISPDSDKSAALIVAGEKPKNNVLTDFINLVGDVASISDHTDEPSVTRHVTGTASISDSEELIPVNAGYKSKNNNWNVNSITEVPIKTKNQVQVTKQKIIEIEDDDSEGITDAPPPHDKVEPTTRRPIIDNVSDDMVANKTDKKDIEIITQTYVPSVNSRPTKIMKKSEKTVSEETSPDNSSVSLSSAETATESKLAASSEITTSSGFDTSSETSQRIEALPLDASSTTQ